MTEALPGRDGFEALLVSGAAVCLALGLALAVLTGRRSRWRRRAALCGAAAGPLILGLWHWYLWLIGSLEAEGMPGLLRVRTLLGFAGSALAVAAVAGWVAGTLIDGARPPDAKAEGPSHAVAADGAQPSDSGSAGKSISKTVP